MKGHEGKYLSFPLNDYFTLSFRAELFRLQFIADEMKTREREKGGRGRQREREKRKEREKGERGRQRERK